MEEKIKPKTHSMESKLIWQSLYEFAVSYNVDECIEHINQLEVKYQDEGSSMWYLSPPRYGIDSQDDNGGVFNFRMSGRQSRVMLEAQLRGQLIYKSDNQTQIKVRVGFTQSSTAVLVGLLPTLCAFLLIAEHPSSGYETALSLGISAILYGFIFLIQIVFGYSLKSELYYDIHEALMKGNTPSKTIIE